MPQRRRAAKGGAAAADALFARAAAPARSREDVLAAVDAVLGGAAAPEAAAAYTTRAAVLRSDVSAGRRAVAAFMPPAGFGAEALAEREEALQRRLAKSCKVRATAEREEEESVAEIALALQHADTTGELPLSGWPVAAFGEDGAKSSTCDAADHVCSWYERVAAIRTARDALRERVAVMSTWQRPSHVAKLRAELELLGPAVLAAAARAQRIERKVAVSGSRACARTSTPAP